MQYSPTPAPASSKDATGHVLIKGPADQAAMRVAGRLAADVLDMIGPKIVIPTELAGFAAQLEGATGMTTPQLMAIAAGVVELGGREVDGDDAGCAGDPGALDVRARRGPAGGGAGFDRIGRAVVAHAVAGLGDVADARGGAGQEPEPVAARIRVVAWVEPQLALPAAR